MLTRLGEVGAGAEEREKTEPLLYFMSHGCSGPTELSQERSGCGWRGIQPRIFLWRRLV